MTRRQSHAALLSLDSTTHLHIVRVNESTFASNQIVPRVRVLYFEESDLPISDQRNGIFQPRRISRKGVIRIIIHGAIARECEVKMCHFQPIYFIEMNATRVIYGLYPAKLALHCNR